MGYSHASNFKRAYVLWLGCGQFKEIFPPPPSLFLLPLAPLTKSGFNRQAKIVICSNPLIKPPWTGSANPTKTQTTAYKTLIDGLP